MSIEKHGFLNSELSKKTSIFGLPLWVVLGVCVGASIVLVLFLISLWVTSKRNSNSNKSNNSAKPIIPNVSKEIQEIRIDPSRTQTQPTHQHQENPKNSDPLPESDPLVRAERQGLLVENENPNGHQRIHIEIGKGHRISYPERSGGGSSSGEARSGDQMAVVVPEVSHLGWGHWYTLRELEVATNSFADENVIGEGGYGIVYSGVLVDNTTVAVKNLLNNRGQAEKEFKVEVEAIGRVRHKNLVRLLGYCAEGAHRQWKLRTVASWRCWTLQPSDLGYSNEHRTRNSKRVDLSA